MSEKPTCPFRMPGEYGEFDGWRMAGDDKVCAYCGSWHPNELKAWLPGIDGLEQFVTINDRRDKIYVVRPHTANASEGAIKFKVAHADDELIGLINQALALSKSREMERLDLWSANWKAQREQKGKV